MRKCNLNQTESRLGRHSFSPTFGLPDTGLVVYRPMSYYMLGGVDLTGETLCNAEVSYDSDADIDSGCDVDTLSNPNVSLFDIVEKLGREAASQVKTGGVARPNENPTPGEPPKEE